jgi:hypothetical protein
MTSVPAPETLPVTELKDLILLFAEKLLGFGNESYPPAEGEVRDRKGEGARADSVTSPADLWATGIPADESILKSAEHLRTAQSMGGSERSNLWAAAG